MVLGRQDFEKLPRAPLMPSFVFARKAPGIAKFALGNMTIPDPMSISQKKTCFLSIYDKYQNYLTIEKEVKLNLVLDKLTNK